MFLNAIRYLISWKCFETSLLITLLFTVWTADSKLQYLNVYSHKVVVEGF